MEEHDDAVIEYHLDSFNLQLAEDRVEVVQAHMGYVDLILIIFVVGHELATSHSLHWLLALVVLFANLKEALLDFGFNLWLQLLFLEEQFQILSFEILQELLLALLLVFLQVCVHGLWNVKVDVRHRIVIGLPHWIDDRQLLLFGLLGLHLIFLAVVDLLPPWCIS